MTSDLDNLIVYQASAGSGKTYKLVLEYLTLLLEGIHENGHEAVKYRSILVVTFTNKATVELRERILAMLFDLSQGRGNMRNDLLRKDWDKGSLTPAQKEAKLREYAKKALKEILEDYAHFRVQTIDSFFQEVVRSFVLEIDRLHSGFEIELDQKTIASLSLDDMLREMSRKGGDAELSEAVRFLYDAKKEDDEKVKFEKELLSMMSTFLTDPLSPLAQELRDDYLRGNKLPEAVRALKELRDAMEQRILNVFHKTRSFLEALPKKPYFLPLEETTGKVLFNLYRKISLPDQELMDIWAKGEYTGLTGKKLRKAVEDGAADPFSWVAKAKLSNYRDTLSAYGDEIGGRLQEFLDACDDDRARLHYRSASVMLKYLKWIPVLLKFREKIDDFERDNSIVLISEINDLLSDIIAGSDTPFIYDKVGTRIEHYLIDEFQDTNAVQWHNFLPLLAESLSKGNRNYIVGDVKQSIYRFRGGDSELLGSVLPEAKGEEAIEHLGINYRSSKEIVSFNNDFFGGIYDFRAFVEGLNGTKRAQEKRIFYPVPDDFDPSYAGHKRIYSEPNVHQDQPQKNPKEGGFVRIAKGELDAGTLQELLLSLRDDGYRPGDIAILVRANREAEKIADMLNFLSARDKDNRECYRYISNSALLIANNPVVQLITAFLRHMARPGLQSARDLFEVSLFNAVPYDPEKGPEDKFRRAEELKDRLTALSLTGLSLYEAVNGVIDFLSEVRPLAEEELVYVNAFLDRLFDFAGKYPATYGQFDEWWQAKKDSLFVEMSPTAVNALQLHTIHNVKGLEFPVVILPFGDWEIVKKRTFNRPDARLYDIEDDADPVLRANVSKLTPPEGKEPLAYPSEPRYFYFSETPTPQNASSLFRTPILRELEAQYMDSLNLLYVAFTRPSERLYVYLGPEDLKGSGKIIADRLKKDFGHDLESSEEPFLRGTETPRKEVTEQSGDELLTSLSASPKYDSLAVRKERFESPRTDRGLALHRIMEGIRTPADIEAAFAKAGSGFEAEREALRAALDASGDSLPGFFFSPGEGWELLLERSMYSAFSHRVLRTDRLLLNAAEKSAMILDYKFGEERGEYRTKIQLYLRTLREMGYTSARGFLWYNFTKMEEVL